jgi:hypothetical protein
MYNYTSAIEYANAYSALSFKMVPCHTLENGVCSCRDAKCKSIAKHPLTEHGVKDATADPEKLNEYFTGDYAIANIAIATGDPSGVVILDVDDLQALAALEKQNEPLPTTWTVETGSGGRHFYFRFDDCCKSLKNAVKFAGSLDVRATGGYVLLPPSLHRTGNRYRWLVSPNDGELARLPDWRLALMPKHGIPTQTVRSAHSVRERCELYLAKCPPATDTTKGQSFNVCCQCVKLFGEQLTDDELLAALTDWSNRCIPPRDEKTLRHKIAQARKRIGSGSVAVSAVSPNEPATATPRAMLGDDSYYGIAGEIIKRIEPHTESDNASLLLSLLVGVGVCVGRKSYFIVEGTKHHANLYAVLVGRSSRARKGTSLAWINGLLDYADDTFKQRRLSGLSSGEGLIHAVRDAELEKQDGKFVAINGVSDKRAFVVESEFARTLNVAKREGNTLSAILRDSWDTGTLSVLTRGKPLHASDAHVGIVAHITCEELRKTLAWADLYNGFANRFLWANVERSKHLPDGGGDVVLDDLRQRLKEAIDKAKTIDRMRRSPACSELWRQVYAMLVAEKTADGCSTWDAVTSRAEAQTLRLSMLYALLDGSDTIDVPHLRAALAVWRYCDFSARRLFASDALSSKLLTMVCQRPGIMRSELRAGISHTTTTDQFDAALGGLEQSGEIIKVAVYDKRQADRYYPGMPPTSTPDDPIVTQITPPQSPTTITDHSTTTNQPEKNAMPDSDIATTLTLADLLNWKNANAVAFVRNAAGDVWVTTDNENLLTPALRIAIQQHQETLSLFVSDSTREMSDYEFWLALDAALDIGSSDNDDKGDIVEGDDGHFRWRQDITPDEWKRLVAAGHERRASEWAKMLADAKR